MPHWELFLGLAGLSVAIFSYFATHMGINMPLPLAWAGGVFGLLLFIWAILLGFWGPQKVPYGPVLLIIVCLSGVVCGGVWIYKNLSQSTPENQVSSKLTVSATGLEVDQKDVLILQLLFSNDGTKECVIESVGIVIPTKDILLNLNDNDNLDNNFNNKPTMSYHKDRMMAYIPIVNKLPIFPIVLKAGQLYPLSINIPFKVSDYCKHFQLKNIKKLIIGVRTVVLNYKGESREIYIYPFAQLNISNENQIIFSQYKSPTANSLVLE